MAWTTFWSCDMDNTVILRLPSNQKHAPYEISTSIGPLISEKKAVFNPRRATLAQSKNWEILDFDL